MVLIEILLRSAMGLTPKHKNSLTSLPSKVNLRPKTLGQKGIIDEYFGYFDS